MKNDVTRGGQGRDSQDVVFSAWIVMAALAVAVAVTALVALLS